MPIYDTYSRRKKREQQTESDVFQYDAIPVKLRTQIEHILNDAIGPYRYGAHGSERGQNNGTWDSLKKILCREHGRHYLSGERYDPKADCIGYLRAEPEIDNVLDLIQFCFLYIERTIGKMDGDQRNWIGIIQTADNAIEELNFRFREAGAGYQYENGKILRLDSLFVHDEVVRPALTLLTDPRFKGAQEEFLDAHAHYRAGEPKATNAAALNAFESTMKAICDIKGWEYKKGARAADLIKVIRAHDLLPDYLDNPFDQLIATLKSGLPKVRNEEGGHGQGAEPKQTPGYIAAYALHLAAANIVLLVEALKASE